MLKSPRFVFFLLGMILMLGLSEAATSSSKAKSSLIKQRILKAKAKKEAKKVVREKVYQPVSKQQALRQISAKLKSVSKAQPTSVLPSKQTDPQLKKLSADELKQLKTLYTKMSTIAVTITNLIPILTKNRLTKMRDGRTALDHLNDTYAKMEQLKPQFKAVEDKFPRGREVVDVLRQLERQVRVILDDEEKEAKATIAQQEHEVKVKAKAAAAAPPAGIVGAQCQSGACCDTKTFKFLVAGTSCNTTECVTGSTCLGTSEICPTGSPLPDGTTCSKGKCLSGICVKDKTDTSCTEGPCCDTEAQMFREKGAACVIPEDSCQEPAELCSGVSATCLTTNKPDGTQCKTGVCKNGECVKAPSATARLIDREERLYRMKKAEYKRLKEEREHKELKNLIRRFGVLLWMNSKLDSMEADLSVAQYLSGVPGAPTALDIFDHHRVPVEPNKVWERIFSGSSEEPAVSVQGIPVTQLIAPEDDDTNSTNTEGVASLQSGSKTTTGLSTSLGVGLGLIGVVLIVCYFVFAKKKTEPEVIY